MQQGNFDLDEFPALHDRTAVQIYPLLDGIPYYLLYRNRHYPSAYTPGPGVLAWPIYLVPVGSPVDSYLLYVRNLLPHKNRLSLLDALAILRRRRPARLIRSRPRIFAPGIL